MIDASVRALLALFAPMSWYRVRDVMDDVHVRVVFSKFAKGYMGVAYTCPDGATSRAHPGGRSAAAAMTILSESVTHEDVSEHRCAALSPSLTKVSVWCRTRSTYQRMD
jgi:hypothetical protein